MTTETAPPDLVDQITERATDVRRRIAEAADRAGRDAEAVTLVAVTKTHPLETVRAAIAAGLRDLGENRVQELVDKSDAIPGEADGGDVRWHLIGSLQRNKARDAAARADLFHALDSVRLAKALEKKAADAGRVLPVLVQVNISGEDAKHGVEPEDAYDLLQTAAERGHLRPVGLMGMAAIAEDDDDLERVVRPAFRTLRQLYEGSPIPLSVLSMGMSGDYEVAVEEGATHVRVGSALFGPR
ncbi:YggS family pyridoxal phosphate-dependent enzyme [Rubrivirga marina]|uniref:Pyridoxal phosphate homeostasis protein n=1 Tax=Rubrivirga marina TaxID=1196024 RepID=A0A271J3Q1_9BACT|nr:YggS family pyridoxal phosphate-dependent enzyme [Rubrivirga marina]PAP78073.1 YggS family pyridoxal phosphate enzyme [Rubrivirga marina]